MTNGHVPTRLNIGSGPLWNEASLNIDIWPAAAPDIVADMSRRDLVGMRFPTVRFGEVELAAGRFTEIVALHVLEHVPDLVGFMTNCLDLLQDGGIMTIRVPYDLSHGAWQDPTHVRAFNERSWLYYTDWSWMMGWTEARFDLQRHQMVVSPYGRKLHQAGVAQAELATRPRAIDELDVELRKRPLTEAERLAQQRDARPHLATFPQMRNSPTAGFDRPAASGRPDVPAPPHRPLYLDLLQAWLEEIAGGRGLGPLRHAAEVALDRGRTGDFLAAGQGAAVAGALLAGVVRNRDGTNHTWIAAEDGEDTLALERVRVLDGRVTVLSGPLGGTTVAPIERLSMLAVGGDARSVERVLPPLFDRVEPGGRILVDAAGEDALHRFLAGRNLDGPGPAQAGGYRCWTRPQPLA